MRGRSWGGVAWAAGLHVLVGSLQVAFLARHLVFLPPSPYDLRSFLDFGKGNVYGEWFFEYYLWSSSYCI